MSKKMVNLIGYASGLAAATATTSSGPLIMQQSPELNKLINKNLVLNWQEIIAPDLQPGSDKISSIITVCNQLAIQVASLLKAKQTFAVLGGDHSCAIGTWSGAYYAIKNEGQLGLIWVDAHMDSHTPHTSRSGNIHGMPLACLMGYGLTSLTQILDKTPKIKPENLCLIGVRSFERGEAALLKELNVRIFFIEEVKERGVHEVMKEAIQIASQNTAGFGISIDIDSIDPTEAPGTGCPEPNGLSANKLCEALYEVAKTPGLIGFEIAEFDPNLDKNHQTEKLIARMIEILTLGKSQDEVVEGGYSNSTNVGL